MLQTFTATAQSMAGLQVKTQARNFEIMIDEPAEFGGTDTGMNPVEAVLCALGSCLTIVIAAFAEGKNFKYEDVRVELEGDLDPDGFMGLSDARKGFQEIRYTIHIKTDEPRKKIDRFFAFVEETCPLCDILKNNVPVKRAGIITE